MHECILYYLRERDENLLTPNTSLTYIIITDFYQFYIFKSSEFKRLFESRQIKSLYKNFTNKKGLFEKNPKNEDFYSELKKILSSVGFLDSVRDSSKPSNSPHTNPSHTNLSQENPPQANIEGYCFDLRNFDSLKPKDKAHIATLLSPEFLHDERTLDPNAISEPFYRELLHILGLTEKEQRKIAIDESQENSFAKHIFYKLEQKIPKDSLLDSMMNLIIIWLNRILFLKLIESKLLEFNDNDTKLCFLTSHKIKDFATLEHLFFEVLAKNYDERQNVIDRGFHYLPYLNSSLFSKDEIETRLLSIGTLDSSLQIAYYPHTILQDREGKAKTGKTTFLAYLFDFLNSYAFGLETSKRDSMKDDSIINDSTSTDSTNTDFGIDTQSHSTNPQTTESTIYKAQSHADSQTTIYHTHTSQTNTSYYTSKTIIKSSVLGSVFERLNGYKEGSFYTPSFITNYMCKEAIDKAVVEKFNTQYGFRATNLAELQEDIKDSIRSQRDKTQKESTRQEFKKTLLSLTLCDPSVGSGHFLVSALNYLVFIHWYLKLALQGYEENSKRHSYDIEDLQIIDDEIILLDSSYSSISYTRPKALNKAHRIQKELFTLKKEIIESCLFGVDINPISCHIAQLRLWIELLKSTYYTDIESNSAMQGKLDSTTHRLETLPNIDINIKEGNSLVSNFEITESDQEGKPLPNTLKWLINQNASFANNFKEQVRIYKENVSAYKNALRDKATLVRSIENIKQLFKTCLLEVTPTHANLIKNLKKFVESYGDEAFDIETPFGMEMIKLIRKKQKEQGGFRFQPNLEQPEPKELDTQGAKILDSIKSDFDTLESIRNADTFEWRFAFPEVLDNDGDFRGFDVIVGNPPYMQVPKGIFNKSFFPYSEGKDKGKQNLYKVFVELAYNLGHENSIISLITQSSIMCDLSAQFTRELLLTQTQMHYFVEFKKNQKIFTNVIQGVCIMEFTKAKPKNNHSFKIAINNTESKMDTIDFEHITQRQILEFFPLYEIPLIKKGEMPIVAKVKSDKVPLKSLLTKSLQGNINTIHLKKIQSKNPSDIRIIKGAHCHRYYMDSGFYGIHNELTQKIITDNTNQYIITTQNITGTSDKIRIYANFVESKNTKFVFLDSCNISYCKNARDAKFLVGLLNSKLLNWLFKITSTNNHVNLYELESLPIPKIDSTNKALANEIISLVEQILESKTKDSNADTTKLESQIDSLVYRLYNLTDNEIDIIQSS